MKRAHALLLCCGLAVGSAPMSEAHEGEAHHEAAASVGQPAATASDKPQRLQNGDLYIPKPVQRLLGIRTEMFVAGSTRAMVKLQGEIINRPDAPAVTSSPQAGVLEAPEDGWPLPGATVKAGQILAYLQPQLTLRDAARRSAQSNEFEQRVTIAELNVERLRLQSSAAEGQLTTGNVYYEQALTELDAARQQRDLAAASPNDRLPLRAATSGVLIRNNLRNGEMVTAGQSVFEVNNPAQLRVSAYSFDPRLLNKVQSARLLLEGQQHASLRLRGQEPLPGQPGWRLLFDVAGADSGLSPGMPVNVELNIDTDTVVQQLAKACVLGQSNTASVWLHVAPERFAPRHVASCDASRLQTAAWAEPFKPGDRLVVAGGALLAQYR